jgi:hypothetical protein
MSGESDVPELGRTYLDILKACIKKKHLEVTVDSKRVTYVPNEKGVVFEEISS